MTVILNKNIAHAIYLASKDKNHEEQSLVFKKVAQFLARKRLLSKTKEILSFLNKIINEHEGRVVAKVSSVEKINEKTHREITQALAHHYKAKEIKIVENLDKKLLGGLKIEVNDEVIDLTIKNKIGKLQEHLTKSL
jgi:F-type H+-transporting ATPase subunit delta